MRDLELSLATGTCKLEQTSLLRSHNYAKKGYEEIDEAAVHLLPCGGYLATCSCSHFTTQELLSEAIQTAAHHMKNVRLRQIELR